MPLSGPQEGLSRAGTEPQSSGPGTGACVALGPGPLVCLFAGADGSTIGEGAWLPPACHLVCADGSTIGDGAWLPMQRQATSRMALGHRLATAQARLHMSLARRVHGTMPNSCNNYTKNEGDEAWDNGILGFSD